MANSYSRRRRKTIILLTMLKTSPIWSTPPSGDFLRAHNGVDLHQPSGCSVCLFSLLWHFASGWSHHQKFFHNPLSSLRSEKTPYNLPHAPWRAQKIPEPCKNIPQIRQNMTLHHYIWSPQGLDRCGRGMVLWGMGDGTLARLPHQGKSLWRLRLGLTNIRIRII